MKTLSQFSAVYCSGLVIPNQATVAALALLFDRVYLPNNMEFVLDVAKTFRIEMPARKYEKISITLVDGGSEDDDPLRGLTRRQRETAHNYLFWCTSFAFSNRELLGEVIETDMFDAEGTISAELVKKGGPGEPSRYRLSPPPLTLVSEDMDKVKRMIDAGYVPVIGNLHGESLLRTLPSSDRSAKELAALLAMQSIEMFFPATTGAPPELILEARDKLRDYLPVFWASMLKLSTTLRLAIKECKTYDEVAAIGRDTVDTLVRPAIMELNDKIEKERKQWFKKIFGSVYRALKVGIGNPPLTQAQLFRTSVMLGVNTAMAFADQAQHIESMKSEAGLTYLLELGSLIDGR